MAELLRMPEVSAGATSALLSAWEVAEGGTYATGEVVAVIETDKAVVDMPAESPGTLVRLLVAPGSEVAIGEPIALVAAPGETVDDPDAALAALGMAAAAAPSAAPSAAASATAATAAQAAAPAPSASAQPSPGSRVFASPIARRLAKEAGVDLGSLAGSGPGGRVRRRDVEAAIAAGPSTTVAPVAAAAAAVAPQAAAGEVVAVPHSRLRRAIASRLQASKQQAPHFYVRGTARVDRLLALREELNGAGGTKVSVNDLVVKAVARAHVAVPDMNVTWTDDAILRFPTVDIALAVATPNGLVTPVIRGVERLSITEVAEASRDLAGRAREGQLRQHELEGGTTSVTNLGMFGTEEFAAIINPPQASILAVGAARQEPVVVDGALEVGTVMRVTLSVDHRPVDGVIAAEWMRAFLELLEHPARILA